MVRGDFQKGDLDGSSSLCILDKIRLELDKDKEKWDDFCRELVRGLKIEEHILEAAEQGNKEAWIELPRQWRVRDSYDKGSKRSNKLADYQIRDLNRWLFDNDRERYLHWWTEWRFAKIRLYQLLEEDGFKVRTESVRPIHSGKTLSGQWLVLSFEKL